MNIINIKESLQNMDIQTDFKHNLTTLYECLILDEAKKKELVNYIDAYDIDATNKFLSNEFSSQGLMEYYEDDLDDDDVSSMCGKPDEEIDECNETEEPEKQILQEDLDQKALTKDIHDAVEKFMLGLGFDTSDAQDYTVIEVAPNEDGDMLKVEVRAELGYTDLTTLAETLDQVIQTYDSSAYFEPVTSGIIEAFVSLEATEDEVSPIIVTHWTERFRNCSTLEELKSEYLEYKAEREFMSDSTQEEISVVLDVLIDKFTANGEFDDTIVEELQEGVFGKIGNAIKNGAKKVGTSIKNKAIETNNDLRDSKARIDAEKKQEIKDFGAKDKSDASNRFKTSVGGEVDINRSTTTDEFGEIARHNSGEQVAGKKDYSRNKKTTTKTGKELEKKISDEAKKGRVYTADIGESLVEDFVDDDISFFGDEYDIEYDINDTNNGYIFKSSKSIPDSDGFNTEYSWYVSPEGTHVFVFGDSEIYKPEEGYFDHTCDTEEEATEWFNSYNGFAEDDVVDEDLNTLVNDCKKVADDMKKTMNTASNLSESSDVEDDLDEAKKRKGSLLDKVNKSLKESEEVEKVYTKKNGDYLVKGDNGGYQAFSKDNVHLGHIDEEDVKEAQFKFDKNQFTESINEAANPNDNIHFKVGDEFEYINEYGTEVKVKVIDTDGKVLTTEETFKDNEGKENTTKQTSKITVDGSGVECIARKDRNGKPGYLYPPSRDSFAEFDLDESKSIKESGQLKPGISSRDEYLDEFREAHISLNKRINELKSEYEAKGLDTDYITSDYRCRGYFRRVEDTEEILRNCYGVSYEKLREIRDEVRKQFTESKSIEEEETLTEGSLLDKVNAALAREENTVMESVNKNKVVDWLYDHKTATEDALLHFEVENLEDVDEKDLIDWISEHDQLYDDYKRFFELNEDTETESDEWYVGDDVSGYMYKGEEEAKKAYDFLVRRGIKNAVMQRATE